MDNEVGTIAVSAVETNNQTIETSEAVVSTKPVNNWDKPVFRSILSGPDGTGSTARSGILITILAAVIWVTYCIIRNHVIPELTGLTLYETSIITVLYAPNKISEVLTNIKK